MIVKCFKFEIINLPIEKNAFSCLQKQFLSYKERLTQMNNLSVKNQKLTSESIDLAQGLNGVFKNSVADFSEKYYYIEAALSESLMSPAQVKQAAIDVLKAANGNRNLAESEIQKSIKASTAGLDSIVVRSLVRQYPVAVGEKLNRYGSAFDAEASNPAVINLKNNINAANSIRLELNKIK